jgi:hypothetical protein
MANEVKITLQGDDCPPEASLLSNVFAGIRAIETQYATTVMMAVKKFAEELSSHMAGDSGGRSTAETLQLMSTSRKAFEERIRTSYTERNIERESLYDEMKDLESKWTPADIQREIAQTELAIENSEAHIQWMLWDNSVDLGKIMRARLYQSELKAYLRGLRFQAPQENAGMLSESDRLVTSE